MRSRLSAKSTDAPMTRKLISSGTTWERKYGYSRAVQVDNLVMVAGTTAVDEHGNVVAPGNPNGQAKFIYEKIARALAEAGASLADVVRVRTFVVDIGRWEEVAEVQGQVLGTVRPAATLVEVSALVSPELLVEIEVDAIISSDRVPWTHPGPERRQRGRPRSATKGVIPVAVHDEFGTLRSAIVHDGRNASDVTMADWRWTLPPSELAKNPHLGPSSKARLVKQHAGLRKWLAKRGVTLLAPEAQHGAFGQVFTRDPCFAIGERLFIGGLRDEWRHAEATGLSDIRARFESVIDLSGDGATIEGGDVMVFGSNRRVLVGLSRHTNTAGAQKLADALAGSGLEVIRVPHEALHLDCCLAPLPNGEALYTSAWLPRSSVSALERYFKRLIPLNRDEATRHLAANIVWLDRRTVISATTTGKTNALLRGKGYDVIELAFSDLVRQWGSFRCAVCPIQRDPVRESRSPRGKRHVGR
jgi:N-dimethylarginine dimethylaminohydrolase/enamine deaminase RidA (YjgF/YER057c/UK114 family)